MVLSVHRVGFRDKIQAVRLCGLSQITGPHSLFKADFVYSHHVCAHTHGHAYPEVCMWRSQDKSVESVPSFHFSRFQESNPNRSLLSGPPSTTSLLLRNAFKDARPSRHITYSVTCHRACLQSTTFHTCHSNSLTSQSLQGMKWPLHIAHSDATLGVRARLGSAV